jgi:hypothetical protein
MRVRGDAAFSSAFVSERHPLGEGIKGTNTVTPPARCTRLITPAWWANSKYSFFIWIRTFLCYKDFTNINLNEENIL